MSCEVSKASHSTMCFRQSVLAFLSLQNQETLETKALGLKGYGVRRLTSCSYYLPMPTSVLARASASQKRFSGRVE